VLAVADDTVKVTVQLPPAARVAPESERLPPTPPE